MKRPSLANLKGDLPALQAELDAVRTALTVLRQQVEARKRLRSEIERAVAEETQRLTAFAHMYNRGVDGLSNSLWKHVESKYKPAPRKGFFSLFHDNFHEESRWRTLSDIRTSWHRPDSDRRLESLYRYLDDCDRLFLDRHRAELANLNAQRDALLERIRTRFRPYEHIDKTWAATWQHLCDDAKNSIVLHDFLLSLPGRLVTKLENEKPGEFMGFPITDAGLARARKREQVILKEIDATIRRTRAADERKKREQHAKERTRAAAAAHFKKTRELADTIKEKLRDQVKTLPVCPYCGRALGGEPHADHIHPVGFGGLSFPENMVYVCADCNIKKRDKTLREFVRDERLDWAAIERRLTLLGKRF